MKLRSVALIGALAFAFGTAPATAKTFRYAFQGDLNALDPYTLNETFTLGAIGNVMEGLTKRDKDLKIIPGLAERWEIVDPLQVALLPAQGRQVPQRRGFHRRRRCVLARSHAQPRLADQDAAHPPT